MTDQKTIAIFGAGTGLGASVAKHFGRAGYRVALVARNPASLDALVADLAAHGVAAHAFAQDLGEIDAIPALVASIEAELGPIHTAVFAPVGNFGFIPAAELSAAEFGPMVRILTLAAIEMAHAVLPGMLSRKDGAIVIADGLSAMHAMPGMSGPGPAMAATRNYILSLHEEIRDRGVFAGLLHIGAMIDRSAGLRAASALGIPLDDPRFKIIDPDLLAQEIWTLVTDRSRVEAILPALPSAQ